MPPSRPQYDPFTDGALRPTTSNATALPPPALRTQPSHQSLRSVAANTNPAHPRQQRDLLAPSMSRRPTSRAMPHEEGDVLADSDTEQDLGAPRQRRLRRMRHVSPDGKLNKLSSRQEGEAEMVIRQGDGSYIREIPGQIEALKGHLMTQELLDESRLQAMDDEYAALAHQYFALGPSLSGRGSKKHEEEYEELRAPMMSRLREQVLQKLEDERWRYEPTAH